MILTTAMPVPERVPKIGFLIAGVQKGGTTSLDAYLRQHPSIGMGRKKELHFFDKEERFAEGAPDYADYERRLEAKPSARLFGEATPIYSYWPPAPARIRAYNPAMKLIILLRDPIARAWSHWRMECERGKETLSFSEAIRSEALRLVPLSKAHRTFSYVDRGFYAPQIERLRAHFPDRQILFLKSERFFAEPQAVVAEVLRFLDLPPHDIDVTQIHRPGAGAAAMMEEDRHYLAQTFVADIRLVEGTLGWDCSDWCERLPRTAT